MASSSPPSSQTTTAEFIENFNRDYLQRHKSYEDNFWETKMDLKGNSVENLNTSFNALETFLGDQNTLEKVRELLKRTDGSISEEQKIVLNQIEKNFEVLHRRIGRCESIERIYDEERRYFTKIQKQLEDAIHGQRRKGCRHDADGHSNQNAFGSRGKRSEIVLGNVEEKRSVLIG